MSIYRGGRFCPAESWMSVETAGESFIEVAPMRDWVAGVAYGNRVLVWRLEQAWMDVGCTFNGTISSGVLWTFSYAETATTSVVRKMESGMDVNIHLSRRDSEELEVTVERCVAGIHAYVNEYHSGVVIVRGSSVAAEGHELDHAFAGASKFYQPLDTWTTSRVTTMEGWFDRSHFQDVRSFMRQVRQEAASSRRTFPSVDASRVATRIDDSTAAGGLMDATI